MRGSEVRVLLSAYLFPFIFLRLKFFFSISFGPAPSHIGRFWLPHLFLSLILSGSAVDVIYFLEKCVCLCVCVCVCVCIELHARLQKKLLDGIS